MSTFSPETKDCKRMFKRAIAFCVSAVLELSSPACAQPAVGDCELHFWPTSNYGAVFLHSGNFMSVGRGVAFDLINTVLPQTADKARTEFDVDYQKKVVVESLKRSGKFANYKIILHDPLVAKNALKYSNFQDKSFGLGAREDSSSATCYAELHVEFITLYKTLLSKKFMSGYLLRFFPKDPNENAKSADIKHSEATTGLSDFDFSAATLSGQEGGALAAGFKTNLDKFLSRNSVSP